MATVNLTRKNGYHKKRGTCVAAIMIDFAVDTFVSADDHEVLVLPPNSFVKSAQLQIITANNATTATADVGFGGGDTLIDGVNLKATAGSTLSGGTNAAVPAFRDTGGTVTFTPTVTGTATVGRALLLIEYVEVDKTTGELTNFSET